MAYSYTIKIDVCSEGANIEIDHKKGKSQYLVCPGTLDFILAVISVALRSGQKLIGEDVDFRE